MIIRGKPLKQWYGGIMKCYGTGYGMVLGRFQGILNLALIGSSYLLLKGYEPSFTETIGFGAFALIAIFVSGYIFIKLGLQKAEMGSLFNEQPQWKEMYERIQVMSGQIQTINEYLAGEVAEKMDKEEELPTEYEENGKTMLRFKTSYGWLAFEKMKGKPFKT